MAKVKVKSRKAWAVVDLRTNTIDWDSGFYRKKAHMPAMYKHVTIPVLITPIVTKRKG